MSHNFRYTSGWAGKATGEGSGRRGLLTRAQREFYESNGFLILPALVSPFLIDECRERFLDIVEGRVDKG